MRYRIRVFFTDQQRQAEDRFVDDAPDPNAAFALAVPDVRDVSFAEVYQADAGAAPVSSRMAIEAVDVLDRFICECGGAKYYLREDNEGRKTIAVKRGAEGTTVLSLEMASRDVYQFPDKVREAALRALGGPQA